MSLNNVTAEGQVCLRSHTYYLARYKKTGEVYGKRGSISLGPEHFFDTISGCKCGITWIINNECKSSWHPLSKDPDSTNRDNWEVVEILVTAKVV